MLNQLHEGWAMQSNNMAITSLNIGLTNPTQNDDDVIDTNVSDNTLSQKNPTTPSIIWYLFYCAKVSADTPAIPLFTSTLLIAVCAAAVALPIIVAAVVIIIR